MAGGDRPIGLSERPHDDNIKPSVVITLSDVSVNFGEHALLEHANAVVHPGHRIGLVGANGSGKSTLFSLLLGRITADTGQIHVPHHWSVAHMAQHIDALERSALDFVLDGDQTFREAERAVAEADQQSHGDDTQVAAAIAQSHEALEAAGGYQAQARAARLLAGLGFQADAFDAQVGSFSGGWRIRLSLAQALMSPSDLLLLDEPTNHLDLETVTWLEGWLRHYPGTLIVISHDRDFLDSVVDTIIHIEHRQLTTYRGDYTQFERQRGERLAQQQARFEKQQKTRAHMQRFVDRFRAKASKAKAAQSRLKALAKLETIAPAHVDSPFQFQFFDAPSMTDPLIRLDGVRLGYGDHVVIDDIRQNIAPGDRIGLLGLNGAGKSTLIKAIAGQLKPQRGTLHHAKDFKVGYFAQHQIEQLETDQSALCHIQQLDEAMKVPSSEQSIRDFLGGFDFSGEMAKAKVGQYSGGERARLVLALLVRQQPNVLLLDEPTNHLDLAMRHALTVALQSFDGAVIVVSHDRHLLTNTVDQFWLVDQATLAPFDGDLDDYRHWLRARHTTNERQTPLGASKKQRRQHSAALRQQLKPLENKLKNLSQSLDRLGSELKALDETLADPQLYHDPDQADAVSELIEKRSNTQRALERAETDWMETAEAIEAMKHQSG